MLTIIAADNADQQVLLEIEGPFPGDLSKYGAVWKLYRYSIVESDHAAKRGEIHAIPEEGLVRLIERISIRSRQ